jgi:F-type H+-transporting ATPase subunit delta
MKSSKQVRRDAKTLFRACKADGLLDENRVRKTVGEVIAKKPRGYVAILSHLHRLVRLDLERRAAGIESAAALPETLVQSVRASLTKRYGQGVNISFAVNKELIGGLRVKVGSDVFDGSIRARLDALQDSF